MPVSMSASVILRHMAEALPTHKKDDTTSDICTSYEAIALCSHACMIASGFRLIGFSEENRLGENENLVPRLSHEWNATFNSHSFLYAHQRSSSMEYVIKVDRLGSKAQIRGIGLGDEKISTFDITAKDYVSSAALPLRIKFSPDGEEDRSDLGESLEKIFISPSRIQDFASLFDMEIIKKLVPGLSSDFKKFQSLESDAAQNPRENPQRRSVAEPKDSVLAQPQHFHIPPSTEPHNPLPDGGLSLPGFDDEYDLLRSPPRHGLQPSTSPFNIGYDDLNPQGLGPHDPLQGSLTGGGFIGNMRGMHPTFEGPLFEGGERRQNPRRLGVPEGARYDPVGPGDGPFRGPNPFNPFGGFRDGDII